MDISKLKVGENSYNIKDETAINRLNATTLVATYTEEDETLALSVNTQVQS